MTRYGPADTESTTVNTLLEKLGRTGGYPRVNLPALARRDSPFMSCWHADDGCVFISSDFSSLEPSITAHFSQDTFYRYAVCDGIGKEPRLTPDGVLMIDDIYLMTASVMPSTRDQVRAFFADPANCQRWLTDAEGIKNGPLKGPRKLAKPACLGFGYGMRPKKYVNMCYDAGISVSISEARDMYAAYWNLFAGLRDLVDRLNALMEKKKFIINPFGYRLTTEGHKAFNGVIQSTASGVVDVLSLSFFDKCPEARFEAMIHDEIVYQVPEAQVEHARAVQDACVVELNETLGWSVPMRLGFTVAKTFADIK